MRRITTATIASASALALSLGWVSTASADVLLSTDFNNTGIDTNGDMTGIVWTENGLSAQTTIGATESDGTTNIDIRTGGSNGEANNGFFSPDQNVSNPSSSEASPAWTSTFTITVGASDLDLTDILLNTHESNSAGALGSGNGQSNINITIKDNTSTLDVFDITQTRTNQDAIGQDLTYTPASAVALTAGNTYDVTLTVWRNSGAGHFESVDSISFNGEIVPEPSSLALLALGGLCIGYRRRRRG